MKFDEIPFMPKEAGSPWLPASVADARKYAYYGVVAALIILFVEVVLLIFSILGGPGELLISGGLGIVIGVLIIVLAKPTLFDPLDQGKFKDANLLFLVWGILGLALVVPGILILIGFIKLQDVFSPQYQQYKPQQGQVAKDQPKQPAPEQPQAPPQEEAPVAPEAPAGKQDQQKVEMVRCKKCGVQYPAFMHHCPNCNEPR